MPGLTDSEPGTTERAPFDVVYRESRARVVRTALLIVGDHAVAEEIAQEAFLRLYRHFDEVENPGGFLRTATVRICVSWRRRATLEDERATEREPLGAVGDPELDTTWDALAGLKPEQRAALVLRFYEDLSHEQIAELMGCRVATARTRVHRALAALRKELER